MTKKELRKQFKAWRQGLSKNEVGRRSHLIADNFIEEFLVLPRIKCLHVFLPIEKFNEMNTWSLIHIIWNEFPEIKLVVSSSDFKDYSLMNYLFEPSTVVKESPYGIPEPVEAVEMTNDRIDAVLVPLLCADKKGCRVGYGKGFYDRFLAQCRPDVKKIGVGFSEQLIDSEINDVNELDEKLDYFVSEEGVIRF